MASDNALGNYILGNGTVGSLAKLVLPGWIIISSNTGESLPICVLWETENVDTFIQKYNLDAKEKRFKLHFIGNNYEKYNKLTKKLEASKPSEDRFFFDGYEIKLEKKRSEIKKSVKCINIDEKKITFSDDSGIKFNKLFICSPLDFDIVYKGTVRNYSDKYSSLTGIEAYTEHDPTMSDYFYTIDDEYLDENLYRITKKDRNDYIFEFAEKKEIALKNFENLRKSLGIDFGELVIKDSFENKHAHFYDMKLDEIDNSNGVFFLSRYSRFDNNFKLNDTIDILLKWNSKN